MPEKNNYLTENELATVNNQVFSILMPFTSFFINSRIEISWDEEKETAISVTESFNEKKTKCLYPTININCKKIAEIFHIDLTELRDPNDIISLNQNLFIFSLVLCHELMHWILGDVFLTKKQKEYLDSKDTFLPSEAKYKILNIYEDCIINEQLFVFVSIILKSNYYYKPLLTFFNKSVNLSNLAGFGFDNVLPSRLDNIFRTLQKEQNSWKALLLTEEMLKNYPFSYFLSFDAFFTDIFYYGYNEGDNTVQNILFGKEVNSRRAIEMLKQIKTANPIIPESCRNYSKLGKDPIQRLIEAISKSSSESIFSDIIKFLKILDVIKDNDIVENPDNAFLSGYNPRPKECLFQKNGIILKDKYYDFKIYSKDKDELVFYMDVSGSIDDLDIADFKRGLIFIKGRYPSIKIKCFAWSTVVFVLDGPKGVINSTGGTDFRCVIDHIRSEKYRPGTCVVIITDGFFEIFPIKEMVPANLVYKFILTYYCNNSIKTWLINSFNLNVKKDIYHFNKNLLK